MATTTIPSRQRAVQLVGPDQLTLNENKEVFQPGPHQILGRVEVVGLCFSDLKLLKQFSGHVRKSEVKAGVDQNALLEMPHYVPGDKPTVPGHETVIRVVKVGPNVTKHKVGGRYLLQTDYRWLPTANSASAVRVCDCNCTTSDTCRPSGPSAFTKSEMLRSLSDSYRV